MLGILKKMESDFCGLQKQIWQMMQQHRKEINELIEMNTINEEIWVKYRTELFKGTEELEEVISSI